MEEKNEINDENLVKECARKAIERIKTKKEGNLIVFEGIDGSGKTTQARFLVDHLQTNGIDTIFTEWAGSKNVGEYIKKMRKDKIEVVPKTFSLLHAADFAERLEEIINPALSSGKTVICDRYIYTAIARDTVLGVDEDYVKSIYALAPKPDLVFYFDIPPKMALERLMKRAFEESKAMEKMKKGKGEQETATISPVGTIAGTIAGTVTGKIGGTISGTVEPLETNKKITWKDNATMFNYAAKIFKTEKDEEAYFNFVNKVVEKYKNMVNEYNMVVIDAKLPAIVIRKHIEKIVDEKIFKLKE